MPYNNKVLERTRLRNTRRLFDKAMLLRILLTQKYPYLDQYIQYYPEKAQLKMTDLWVVRSVMESVSYTPIMKIAGRSSSWARAITVKVIQKLMQDDWESQYVAFEKDWIEKQAIKAEIAAKKQRKREKLKQNN